LQEHLEKVRRVFESDRMAGLAGVWLPFGLERKYPKAGIGWGWQWVFPSRTLSVDRRAGGVFGEAPKTAPEAGAVLGR
jgi:hypothetical protein